MPVRCSRCGPWIRLWGSHPCTGLCACFLICQVGWRWPPGRRGRYTASLRTAAGACGGSIVSRAWGLRQPLSPYHALCLLPSCCRRASGDVRIGNSEAGSVSGAQGSGSPIGGGLKPWGLPRLPGCVDLGTGQWLFLFLVARPSCPPSGCPPAPSCPSRNCPSGFTLSPVVAQLQALNAERAGASNLDDPGNRAGPCSAAA